MRLMAAGHGRTLQHMVEKMKNGVLLNCITNNFLGVLNRQKNLEPILLLRRIAIQGSAFTFCKFPEIDAERDVILGCVYHDAVGNHLFRDMLETNKCFIHRRVGEGLGDFHFMVTTTLSSFFRMIQSLEINPSSDHLGHLSQAAVALFPTIGFAPTLPTFWERCRAMSLVSRAYYPTETFITVAQVFGVSRDISFGLLDPPQLPRKLEVRLAVTSSDLSFTEDCVIIPPDGQSGWDVAVCTRSGYVHFEQVKLAMPSCFRSLSDHQMENLFAHFLEKTLQYYLDQLGIQPLSTTKQEGQDVILEREQEVFNKVTFVLSMADRDMPKWTKASVETMMEVLRQRLRKGIDSSVALRFVQWHWDHVGYLDWDDLKTNMPPLLLPFAQLAHATLPSDEL